MTGTHHISRRPIVGLALAALAVGASIGAGGTAAAAPAATLTPGWIDDGVLIVAAQSPQPGTLVARVSVGKTRLAACRLQVRNGFAICRMKPRTSRARTARLTAVFTPAGGGTATRLRQVVTLHR